MSNKVLLALAQRIVDARITGTGSRAANVAITAEILTAAIEYECGRRNKETYHLMKSLGLGESDALTELRPVPGAA